MENQDGQQPVRTMLVALHARVYLNLSELKSTLAQNGSEIHKMYARYITHQGKLHVDIGGCFDSLGGPSIV